MIPFVCTLDAAKGANEVQVKFGLAHGKDGLRVSMAEVFLERVGDYFVGGNGPSQLTLGRDRDEG